MIGFEFGIGTLLALLTFLRSEVGGRHNHEELLRIMNEGGKAEQFREWLRQKHQVELVQMIDSSKIELVSELASLGGSLDQFASEVLRISGDLEERFRDLNNRIRPPVLSSLSLPTRPRANVAIKGREREMKWLVESTGDILVSGQPGSGKTELLQTFAAEQTARFIITEDPDEAAAALLASHPPVVVVDDAGTKYDLIIRLRHLRAEQRLSFRIIVVCWPFDKTMLKQVLQVNDAATLDLEGLPRKTIAEIIYAIAASKRVTVNDQFVRVVAKQARGMPGLAASLSLATIDATGEALISGELLLKDLTPFLLRVAGPHAVQLLGAFACGGTKGVAFSVVAQHLGKEIVQVMVDAQRVALAGVLEQTGKETLSVQPDFLRSALLKETFFPTDKLALPWGVCEAVINSAVEPVLGYLELIHACGRAAAPVPIEHLREVTSQMGDPRLWEAMAEMDERNCEWVIESAPALSAEIKRAALHYTPTRAIPILLASAVGETRPLNAFTEADLRLLEDWICASWSNAVERRRMLFGAAISWLKAGGDVPVALSAVRLSFGLNHRETDSDPADPRTLRLRDALLSLDAARAVFDQWRIFLSELSSMDAPPWPGITAVVDNWLHSDTRRGDGIPDDYVAFLLSSTIQMIGDLLPIAGDNQAVLRWAYFRAQSLGMLIEPCPVLPEFLTLFPKEPFDGDWEEIERENTRDAQALANRWIERPIKDIVGDLLNWEKQADALGRVWPQMIPVFGAKLAEIRFLTNEELSVVISNASSSAAGPFVEAAITQGRMKTEHFQASIDRPELHGILIHHTLAGRTPDIYEALQSRLPRWESLVESLCLRGEVTDEMLELLLRHKDDHLRQEVAFYMFRARRGVPFSLRASWSGIVVQSLIRLANGHDADHPYDLTQILAFDSSIAPAVMNGILNSGVEMHGYLAGGLISHLVALLEKEERKALLHRCTHLAYSPLPHLLVGNDEDLYRELLNIAELKRFYRNALIGDPNAGNWIALAKIALAAGHSPKDVSYAVNSGGFGWSGGLSNYFQEWVERFEKLRQNADPDIRRIADEGLKWSKAQRETERRSERLQEIHGFD
ncbi:MAG: hypothetical protein ABJF10_15500 [Chthoniobacter sp.]|uniref:hypothetical protein n=1 Tax=Chthoniobacter sp. TaxID=2510640 RepID=UPI0032AAC8F5